MENNKILPLWDDLVNSERPALEYSITHMPLKHEVLMRWAIREWERRYPSQSCLPVWADEDCANNLALQRVSAGRRLKGKAHYAGFQLVPCPYSVPITRPATGSR